MATLVERMLRETVGAVYAPADVFAAASDATMATNGPAMSSHGHGSRYHRRAGRSAGNDEARLFMACHLLVADGLNNELDLVRART